MQLYLTKLSVILEIDPYVKSLDFFQWKNYRSDFKFSSHVSKEWFYITDKKKTLSEFTLIQSIWMEMYNGYFLFWLSIF